MYDIYSNGREDSGRFALGRGGSHKGTVCGLAIPLLAHSPGSLSQGRWAEQETGTCSKSGKAICRVFPRKNFSVPSSLTRPSGQSAAKLTSCHEAGQNFNPDSNLPEFYDIHREAI